METIDTKVLGKARKVVDKEFTTSGREGKQALIVYHLVSDRFQRARNFTPQDYMNEEIRLEKKLDEVKQKEINADISLQQVIKDLVTLSEILRDMYLYYKLANATEKQQIITKVFSEIRFSQDTLGYQCRNGFKVLEDRSFVFGDPGRNRTCIATSAKLRPIH